MVEVGTNAIIRVPGKARGEGGRWQAGATDPPPVGTNSSCQLVSHSDCLSQFAFSETNSELLNAKR